MKLGGLTVPLLYEDYGRPITKKEFFLETFFRSDKTWVADEAIVEFDGIENKKTKGMAVGIGKIEEGELELVEWCLYIDDSVGMNNHWGRLISYANLVLLQEDIYGCDIYVCNRLWPHMFDDLEAKRNNSYVLDGYGEQRTSFKIANALRHICWCERYGGHYMEKQDIGQMTREEILNIDEDIIRRTFYGEPSRYILRSEYMKNNNTKLIKKRNKYLTND